MTNIVGKAQFRYLLITALDFKATVPFFNFSSNLLLKYNNSIELESTNQE